MMYIFDTKPTFSNVTIYRNLNLGLVTKEMACKVVGQEGSMRVISHALGSAKECEGMNPHTLKWTPILAVGVPMDSQWIPEFLENDYKVKTQWIK